MDTLHDRLAELADDAPTGGAPAADLWARGKRAHRLRAAGLAATLLVVGAVGTGIGVRLADGDDNRSDLAPVRTVGIALPIEYPVGQELPDLGDTPGPLAAIWVSPGAGDGAPEVVGLVAETGMFGTLPLDLSLPDSATPFATGVALSPDGRKVAYRSMTGPVVVRDLMSGESSSPLAGIETRDGFTWYSEAGVTKLGTESGVVPLVGHVAGGTDVDGWIWKPGQAPRLVDLDEHIPGGSTFLEPYGTRDMWVKIQGGGPRSCSPPTVENWSEQWDVPGLCDVLHFVGVSGPGDVPGLFLLGHWNDRNDDNGTVVAVDSTWGFRGHEDADERRVVVTAGAPERVTFATELVGEALDADGGAS